MMKMTDKRRKNAGFTLIESLAAIGVLTLIGALIAVGMNLAFRAQRQSVFEADSAMFCDTLNTALRDVLRFSSCNGEKDGRCRITCPSCGAEDGFFFCGGNPEDEAGKMGVLYLCFGNGKKSQPVVNSGTYGGMKLTDFVLAYDSASSCFSCTYTVVSEDGKMTRESGFTVRTLAE